MWRIAYCLGYGSWLLLSGCGGRSADVDEGHAAASRGSTSERVQDAGAGRASVQESPLNSGDKQSEDANGEEGATTGALQPIAPEDSVPPKSAQTLDTQDDAMAERSSESDPDPLLSLDGAEQGVGDAGVDGGLFGTGDLTVLVIADLSGSMATPWETESRWLTASNTLMEQLEPLQDWLTIGAIFFPIDGDCGVTELGEQPQIPFMSGRGFMAAWQDSAMNAEPGGSTPLGAAFRAADTAIAQAELDGLLEQRFRVVVLTDGEPNCDTIGGELEQFAASWYEKGVETLVLGLPGSSTAEALLNRIASAGGTGEYDAQESMEEFSGSVGLALK